MIKNKQLKNKNNKGEMKSNTVSKRQDARL